MTAQLGQLLLQSARHRREEVAVRMLLAEELLLSRDHVRMTLVWETRGGAECAWDRLGANLFNLGFDDAERAFVHLVLAVTSGHQTSLARVLDLDPRRRVIVVRAIAELADVGLVLADDPEVPADAS